MLARSTSRLSTTTSTTSLLHCSEVPIVRNLTIPTHRPPTTPGEILEEEFLKPLGYTQAQFAEAFGIDRVRLNGLINGRRAVTADTAMRLARVLGTSVEMWLNLQTVCDVYAAQHSEAAAEIKKLKRIVKPIKGKQVGRKMKERVLV